MRNLKNSDLKAQYIQRKTLYASVSAAIVDTWAFLFVIMTAQGIFVDTISLFFTLPEMGDNPPPETIRAAIGWLFIFITISYFLNVCLIMSPWKATLGMKVDGIFLEGIEGNRPSLIQTLKFFLLSPVYMPLLAITIYIWCTPLPPALYSSTTAFILYISGTAILTAIYTLAFGSVQNARHRLTGLTTRLTPKYRTKLEKKAGKKEKSLQRWLTPLTYFDKGILAVYLAVFLYFPAMLAFNHLIPASFNNSIYKPYEINWGNDNAFFALNGLGAPANISNAYQFGKSHAYKDFELMERLKKDAKIPHLFDMPPGTDFQEFAFDQPALEFNSLKNTRGKNINFNCLFDMDEQGPSLECSTPDDVQKAITANAILWKRFNTITNYNNYSSPPPIPDDINLNEYLALPARNGHLIFNDYIFDKEPLRGEFLIELAQLKAAHIVLMQRNEGSESAFKEWNRFMNLYRNMTESRTTIELKAIFMIVFGIHRNALETLLYKDPEIAQNHFDEIKSTLNPQGIKTFRGESLLLDNQTSFEPALIHETGPSNSIQNKIFDCTTKIQKLETFSAKELFQIDPEKICPALQSNNPWAFGTAWLSAGNPMINAVWGLMYNHNLMGAMFFQNMIASDAQSRMIILGAEILNKNIPKDQIETFVKNAPRELQNPIEETPFHWNAQNSYLWFDPPGDRISKRTMHLNLKNAD